MSVVIDSSAWYAYFIAEDSFHDRATSYLQTRPSLTTPNTVFEEVLALIHYRKGKHMALSIGQTLLELYGEQLWYISKADNVEILKIYKDIKPLDYVDASVVWLAKKLDQPIFAFDKHFRHLRVPIVPEDGR